MSRASLVTGMVALALSAAAPTGALQQLPPMSRGRWPD